LNEKSSARSVYKLFSFVKRWFPSYFRENTMHSIIVRAVGKAGKTGYEQLIHNYQQQLEPYAKVQIIELPEGHGGSAKPDAAKTKKAEALSLLQSLSDRAWVVALDETGTNLTSQSLAAKLNDWTQGGRPVVFLIGGSWGLDRAILDRTNFVLSFGKQTLPHLLARVVLCEQLYRAETILNGKVYHK
jgi:23S rRNA (pseudouridine1915-N3)-methyltransferase